MFSIHIYFLIFSCFFFSIVIRHTRCALVTVVQTCALPILEQAYELYNYKLHTRTPHDASASIIVSSRGKDAAEFLMNLYREDRGSAVLINTMPIVRDLSRGGKFDICATKYFSTRKSVVAGTRVLVRVNLGGGRKNQK